MNLYNISPIWLQNFLCTLYGMRESQKRFNSDFSRHYANFLASDNFSEQRIAQYKSRELARILAHCKTNKYYSQYLIDYSQEAIAADPFGALAKLPVLTKENVIAFGAELHQQSDEKDYLIRTSGTTGKAVTLFKTKDSIAAQWAIWFRHRSRFGVKLNDLSVNFTGKLVAPANQTKPPCWRHNAYNNQYLIGMQHLNSNTISDIVAFLNSVQPVFYSGYPSIISEVSRLALDQKLELMPANRPRVIFTGAENILDFQKESIEQWTGTQLTDQYGLTEGNCNFSSCEKGRYHEDFEFSHLEIIDSEELPDGKIKGRLLGTAYFNETFPLLRYDTGDIAVAMPRTYRCPCGRESWVIDHVQGRIDDYVETPDGKRIMRFDYLFKDTHQIAEAQVVQYKKGEVIFRLKLRADSTGDNRLLEKLLRDRCAEWISHDLAVDFEYVDEIEKSSSGKFRAIVNKVGRAV